MIVTKPIDFRTNMKDYMDRAYSGEPITITRPQRRNVVVISEQEYNDLARAARNAAYLAKIDRSIENHKRGDTITFTMEELEAMEDPNWKPTKKVLDFEKAHGIKR